MVYTAEMPYWRDPTFLAFAAACAVLLLLAWWAIGRRGAARLPYFSQEFLLSKGELAFFRILRRALPDGVMVAPKVRLADVIGCTGEGWKRGFGARISRKHVDFVLADEATARILLVVELDDRSHQRADRRKRDAFVDDALAAAGVPILHVTATAAYDPSKLRREIGLGLRYAEAARGDAVR